MSTLLRFPPELPPPLRDGYGIAPEDGRLAFEPEVGLPRRRRTAPTEPLRFELTWQFTQAQYTLFDLWWQDTIAGGTKLFDIQLLNDRDALVWYTCEWIGEYEAEIVDVADWRVKATLRSKFAPFTTRDPQTNNIRGRAQVGTALARSTLEVGKAIRGRASVGLSSATLRISRLPMYGRTSLGVFRARATTGPRPLRARTTVGANATSTLSNGRPLDYPEMSRVWLGIGVFDNTAGNDVQPNSAAVRRNWMEL